MKRLICIAAVAASLPVLAQSVRFDITVVSEGQTNQAVLNVTNAAIAAKVVAMATNKAPQLNPAQAVKAVTKSRLQELVNDADDVEARRVASAAAEAAAQAVLDAARASRVEDAEK